MKKQTTKKQLRVRAQLRAGNDPYAWLFADCAQRYGGLDRCRCERNIREWNHLMGPDDNHNE